jgi:hypothetical protein
MNISNSTYEKEYLAVRYGVMIHSSDIKVKAQGIKNMIDISKKLKWI